MAKRPRIQDLLDKQGESLDRLTDREARRFLRAYEDARRELREELHRMAARNVDQLNPFTAQHLRVMQAQTEAGIARLQERLLETLDASVRKTQERSLGNLLRVIAKQEPSFVDAGGRIEHEVLRRFTADEGLLLHRHSIERYGRDLVSRIQRELVIGVTRGQSWRDISRRISGIENSVLAGFRSRADLIARMELNGAYNDSHLVSITEAGKALDEDRPGDPMLKKADEYSDLRNHALSCVLDGQVRPPDQPFRVSVAKVRAAHKLLQAQRLAKGLKLRRLTGILWAQVGGHYEGMNYPAHYWERGRIVPWRASWAD